MPHIDELLGIATLAAAGLAVAVAIEPIANGGSSPSASSGVATTAAAPAHVQTIEVVARRPPSTADMARRAGSVS